jgi:hypothetical protein
MLWTATSIALGASGRWFKSSRPDPFMLPESQLVPGAFCATRVSHRVAAAKMDQISYAG